MKKTFLLLIVLIMLSGCTVNVVLPQASTAPEQTDPPAQTEIPTPEVPTQPEIPMTEPPETQVQPPRRLIDLNGKPGEFMSVEPETGELFGDPEGTCYGFRDDYWSGCSVWCAVTSHEESAAASSFLEPIGDYSYEPENLMDGDRNTVWSEGVDGNGIGEYIVMTRRYNWDGPLPDQQFDYRTICIVSGYAQNETKWRNNGRVKTMTVHVNDVPLMRLHLQDTMKPQYFDISSLGLSTLAGEEIKFVFTIEDVYPGEKFEDTCITGIEIEFWTPNH